MEGGRRQMRLLGRLLGKLRGGNSTFEKRLSTSTSSGVIFPTKFSNSESTMTDDEDAAPSTPSSRSPLGANIDLSGQCMTPEQLPEFCNQLHHLVEVIRNIQSYGKITGEYPSELEKRLEEEARELAALAAEARNARDVVTRTRAQRRAVRAQKKQLVAHLASLKETETRELENSIRLADRKLYLSWEALKESTDPTALEPLLEEVTTKQIALDNLVRLIECRRSSLTRSTTPPTLFAGADKSDGKPTGLVLTRSHSRPARSKEAPDESSAAGKKKFDGSKRAVKRKRAREPRSVPLSGEPSRHGPQQQDSESTRFSVGSAAAVALPPVELPSRGSYRDIIFFTVN
ncbi:uncharacterized protein LOC125229080 isoform X2 [Leguminivora glycinivorella]|uniref:uncharacterized protein LOC125229080 isoform X2 n=1 Tax=Leguminivora glycinivorella TaxID=1035111 RepID=UPI00200BFA20|nr:uncharacterized protein LOC125229080 isoform X2 [Leguminivora glycinivorella]